MVEDFLAAAAIIVGMVLPGDGGIMVIGAEALKEALEDEQVREGIHLEGHLADLVSCLLHCLL